MERKNSVPVSNAEISGEISDIMCCDRYTAVKVNTGLIHGENGYNEPKIYCFGKVKEIADRELRRGDAVKFICSVQSQNKPSSDDRKNPHNLVAFRIEKQGGSATGCCSFYLTGELLFATRFSDSAAGGVIRSETRVRNDVYVKFAGTGEFIDYVCSLERGTPVTVRGRVITGRYLVSGDRRYSQTLYVTEIENLLPAQ